MTADRWFSRALRILNTIQELEDEELHDIGVAELAARTNLSAGMVHAELRRLLAEGYILGVLEGDMGGDPASELLMDFQLSAEGARAVGAYPSRDPYEALLAILERRIDEAPDEETRSRWRRALDGMKRLGGDVGANLMAGVLIELGKAGI